jgi:asparagine synthase (glutamine-hydrolysing)
MHALCQPGEAARFANWFPLFNHDTKKSLLSAEFARELDGHATESIFAEQLARTDATSPLNRMLYVDTKLWLSDFLLLRGDKLSMAHSLEARVPLLDHKLAEFAALLPPHLKLNRLTRKYLLKKVGQTMLPPEIVSRKKQGFPIPIATWFRQEARPFMRELLSPTAMKKRGLFDVAYVDGLFKEHETGFADHSSLLWGLASLEIWHRQFIDSRPGSDWALSQAPSVNLTGTSQEYTYES